MRDTRDLTLGCRRFKGFHLKVKRIRRIRPEGKREYGDEDDQEIKSNYIANSLLLVNVIV